MGVGAGGVAAGHGFGGFKEQGAAAIVEAGEGFGELAKFAALVAVIAPFVNVVDVVHGDAFGRSGAVVKEAVKWHFESTGILLEGFDRGDGVSILDAGGVAADQAGALLDVALAEIFGFAEFADSLSDKHDNSAYTQGGFLLKKFTIWNRPHLNKGGDPKLTVRLDRCGEMERQPEIL